MEPALGYDKYSGWIDGSVPGNPKKDLNDSIQRTYRLRVDSKPTERLSVGISSWVSRKDVNNPDTSTNERQSTTVGQPTAEEYDVHSFAIGYAGSGFSLASTTAYMSHEAASEIDTLNLFGFGADPLTSAFDTRAYSQEIVVNSAPGSWIWTVGGIYRDLEEGLIQEWPGIIPRLHYVERSKSWAVFGQVGRRFLDDRFEWTVGARNFRDRIEHDQAPETVAPGEPRFEREGEYDALTPTAKLTWKPRDDKMFYVSYGQGFRSGLPLAYTIAVQAPGFPDVEPDKLHNYEIGEKARFWDGALSLDAAVFYIRWQDVQQIISVPFGGNAVAAPINGESASGMGADFSVIIRPNTAIELGLSGGWNDITMDEDVRVGLNQNLQFRKGDRLTSSPKTTAHGFINYRFPLTNDLNGKASLSMAYVSKVQAHLPGTQTAPVVMDSDDYQVVRARVAIASRKGWEFSVFGDNLTDESGSVSPAAAVGDPDLRQRLRPRTFGVQVNVDL
jgi:iron complex outermembrane recepter protein